MATTSDNYAFTTRFVVIDIFSELYSVDINAGVIFKVVVHRDRYLKLYEGHY